MRKILIGAALAVTAFQASAAFAASPLVTNGDFTNTTGSCAGSTTACQVNLGTFKVSDWTVTSAPGNSSGKQYAFIFNGGASGAAGYSSYSQYGGNLQLYTSANGGSTTATSLVSPTGGNFLAIDPSFENAIISQTIGGLTVGQKYALTFNYAGSQQAGFSGATTEGWDVTFGGSTQSTTTLNNASKGFTGWKSATMTFTATSTSQALSFLATGGPSSGAPPFVLLDGVNLNAVPEPATWAMMILGFGMVGAASRNRRRNNRLAAA